VVVSPPLPLLTKPQEDMRRVTFLLLQEGQFGLSDPKTSFSKLFSQSLQQYSYIGIQRSPSNHFIDVHSNHRVVKVNCRRHSARSRTSHKPDNPSKKIIKYIYSRQIP
jgi:hypothetical protein